MKNVTLRDLLYVSGIVGGIALNYGILQAKVTDSAAKIATYEPLKEAVVTILANQASTDKRLDEMQKDIREIRVKSDRWGSSRSP